MKTIRLINSRFTYEYFRKDCLAMTREQAIFLETFEDLNFEGLTELVILAYHDFITGFDYSGASDIEVHLTAKELIKKYQEYWYSDVDFSGIRSEIIEKLDLDDVVWES